MFNLLRHFSIVCAIVVIITTTALAILYHRNATIELVTSAEANNLVLGKSFANTLWPRFYDYVHSSANDNVEFSRWNRETKEIDAAVRQLTSGLPVMKVKIYNLNGLTVYSSDYRQIGEVIHNSPGFDRAAQRGLPASSLSFRGTFSAFSGLQANVSLVESYIPIRGRDGQVEGVFELYTDVTPHVRRITHATAKFVGGLIVAFGLLYATLFLIVGRADKILRQQYEILVHNEAHLIEQNEMLEREIADRQRAEDALHASEQRLRQTQKMEAIGQLTGGIAHDFNNILAVIQGSIDLLEDKIGSDNRLFQTMGRAAARGAELTQRLLAFSRKQPLQARPFSPGRLVAGMSEIMSRTLGENIEIVTRMDPKLKDALADPAQVENALLNLGLNARDAMSKGGTLEIECRNARLDDADIADQPDLKAGEYVVIAVSDNGPGMTPEVAAHAFEPFFTTKEVGKGSGLGLSMIYGFAKQSGGHVTIESATGKGTTVTLYLPIAETAPRVEQAGSQQSIPRGDGEVILVIEDDPDVRDLVDGVLADLNYQATCVGDADAADKALANGKSVDLVLSDVILPGGVSGPDFAQKALKTYPDLKVVFMSGYPAEEISRDGVFGSESVLLTKPFQKAELASTLRQMLD